MIRAVIAGFAVLLTLAGLPVALVVFQRTVDWDVPQIVAQPLSVGGLVAAAVGCGWLLWLLLLRLMILDAIDAVRHVGRAPRLPVPLHTAVTAAASGLMLMLNALRGGAQDLQPPPATPVVTAATWNPAEDPPRPARNTAQPAAANGRSTSSTSSGDTPTHAAAPPTAVAGSTAGGPDIDGVTVPGGWLPLPVLAAIGTAATALWAQRRRGYRPRPPAGAHRGDSDLLPLPAQLRQLLRYDRAVTDAGDDAAGPSAGPAVDRAVAPVAVDAVADTAPRIGAPSGSPAGADTGPADEVPGNTLTSTTVAAAAVPWPGVGLVGPGAHDAARGLLVALSTDPHRDAPPVTVTAEALETLLGASCIAAGSERLYVTDGQRPPAVAPQQGATDPVSGERTDEEIISDVACGVLLLNDTDPVTPAAMPAAGSPAGRRPPPSTPASASASANPANGSGGTGSARPAQPARAVRVGAWPGAVTWIVARDGAVHVAGATGGPGRIAVLDRATARAVLTGLGLLTIPPPPPPTGTRSPGLPSDEDQVTDPAGPSVHDGPGIAGAVGEPWPRTPPDTAHLPRRLRLRMLGQPVVLRPHPDGSVTPVTIRRSAARQILLLLAVRRAPVTADTVKETIWPDVARTAAHRRYLTTMSELRRALADAAGQPVLQQSTNTAHPGLTRYWLDPDTVDVDVWRLHDLLDAAAGTVQQPRRLRLLRQAADLCNGDLADGCAEEWLTADRERLARHALDLRVHLADLEPDHDTAVRLLRRAARDTPGNEAVHRRLLLRHAAAGDSDGLHRAAATLAEHLAAAGAVPEPDTAALAARLLHDVPDGLHPLTDTAPAFSAAGPGTVRSPAERSRP
ncbi:bacterial transcriptional activator domain-containing protein [Dactylosporangium sp. NBC_01737]|uniref:bacterial transcriptional activator domain-containing protein n=1 Tax=Dactylosporangium sp. NBC_01737 TaxID=2975959 RepID=UPI002E1668AF|nr:bacterial transcriptional activator domain-containing protein [Dactylosporangium sp. NBC_01737]